MNAPTEDTPPLSLVAYRLGQLEAAMQNSNLQINRKLDEISNISSEVTKLVIRVEVLERWVNSKRVSKDRIIAIIAAAVIAISVVTIQILFNIGDH